MKASIIFAIAILLGDGARVAAAAADLAEVRELYAAASYEEALAAIETLEAPAQPELVEQLRALCLLGLGRTQDAERSLERLIVMKPLYAVPDDASPRLLKMFGDVRRRSLPAAARQLYARAKTSYDKKEYGAAATQFGEVIAIAKHPDAAAHGAALEDLRQLAEGFKTLSETELAARKAAAEAQAAAAAAAVKPPPPPTPAAPTRYSSGDRDVQAPVALNRTLPSWKPTNPLIAQRTFRGLLEVIVNEEGTVEWAQIAKATMPAYDAELMDATKNWRFRPAMRLGVPVRYQLSLEIVLLPTRQDD
jgi:TonB family protein